jgi:outer membrane protein assembly factor BamE (lipoprotein component of BamABCDE complex)
MIRALILALALTACAAVPPPSGNIPAPALFADKWSYAQIQAIRPGATMQEVRRHLGNPDFQVGFKHTWIESRRSGPSLVVTEVSMYFDANGIMTGHAGYKQDNY